MVPAPLQPEETVATRETAAERYRFRCHHCDEVWTRDYDVARVTLADGDTREYYYYNGWPAAAPSAPSSVSCPACGAEHNAVNVQTRSATETPAPASSPARQEGGATDPTGSSRELAHTIETLLAAARQPEHGGFAQVDDVKEVARSLQNEAARLPQLLQELGNVLEQVHPQPNPRHAGDIPAAIRYLHRAAHTARELTESLTNELFHARTALTSLESFPIGSSSENQQH